MEIPVGARRVSKDFEILKLIHSALSIETLDAPTVLTVVKPRCVDDPLGRQPIAIDQIAAVSMNNPAHLVERQLDRERHPDFARDTRILAGFRALDLVPKALDISVPIDGALLQKAATAGGLRVRLR